MTKLSRGAEPPDVEEGQATVVIESIVVDEDNKYNGEDRPQAVWTFAMDDGQTVKGWTSLSYFEGSSQFPPSKLYQWFKVLKAAPDSENEFNFKELEGTRVSVIIGKNKAGWPRVEKLLKLQSGNAKRIEEAAATAWADDPEVPESVKETFAGDPA